MSDQQETNSAADGQSALTDGLGLPDRIRSWIPNGYGHNSEYANTLAEAANELERLSVDAARWRWLAGDCDGDAQDDFTRWLSSTVASKDVIDEMVDYFMQLPNVLDEPRPTNKT